MAGRKKISHGIDQALTPQKRGFGPMRAPLARSRGASGHDWGNKVSLLVKTVFAIA